MVLERLDLAEGVTARASALVDEVVGIAGPYQSRQTLLHVLVQLVQVLLEQVLFLAFDQVHDVVVVAHNQHHVFLQDAKLILAVEQLGQVDVKVHKTVLGDLIPVANLDQDFSEICVEIALEQTSLARRLEEIILAQEGWLVSQHLVGSLD